MLKNVFIWVLTNVFKIKTETTEKDISRNKLCTMIAANYDLVNRYYNNKVIRIDILKNLSSFFLNKEAIIKYNDIKVSPIVYGL